MAMAMAGTAAAATDADEEDVVDVNNNIIIIISSSSSSSSSNHHHNHQQQQQQHQREEDSILDDKDRGHRYGNFPNYSTFHPPQARLQVLTSTGVLHHIRRGLVGEDLQLPSEKNSNDDDGDEDDDDDSDEKMRKKGNKRLRMTYNAADSPSSLKSSSNTKCYNHDIYYCDLGCNSGELTAAVASSLLLDDISAAMEGDQEYSMVYNVLGVDIDPKLVKRANANFSASASSLVSGSKASFPASDRDIHTNINSNNTATTHVEGEGDYNESTTTTTMKSMNTRMRATFMECDLNSDIEHNAACASFFANVVGLKEANDGEEGVVAVGVGKQPTGVTSTTQPPPLPPSGRLFHLTTIFSTTMWIHIHGGDDGLRSFLERACQWTAKYLLVEPQPSGCYRKANTRLRKLRRPELEDVTSTRLTLRAEIEKEIESIIIQCGFRRVVTKSTMDKKEVIDGGGDGDGEGVAVSDAITSWNRSLRLYERVEQRRQLHC